MSLYNGENQKMTSALYAKNRFLTAGDNLQIIADRITRNDDLCKLLTRYKSDVMKDTEPVSAAERAEVFSKRIRTVATLPKDDEVGAFIVIGIGSITPMGTGLSYNISFDILCNTDVWNLEDYTARPYYIMNEIDWMLSNTKMKGIGPTTFLGAAPIKINEKLLGYTMLFNVGEI